MLLYSNKTEADIAFFDELDIMTARHENTSIVHFLTRNDGKPPGKAIKAQSIGTNSRELHRIDETALKKYIAAPKQKNFHLWLDQLRQ